MVTLNLLEKTKENSNRKRKTEMHDPPPPSTPIHAPAMGEGRVQQVCLSISGQIFFFNRLDTNLSSNKLFYSLCFWFETFFVAAYIIPLLQLSNRGKQKVMHLEF